MEAPHLENSDGTPESVFERFHIGDKFLKMYTDNITGLHPAQKKSIEWHIANMCSRGECQKRIDKLVKKMQDNDSKMAQLPENDR